MQASIANTGADERVDAGHAGRGHIPADALRVLAPSGPSQAPAEAPRSAEPVRALAGPVANR